MNMPTPPARSSRRLGSGDVLGTFYSAAVANEETALQRSNTAGSRLSSLDIETSGGDGSSSHWSREGKSWRQALPGVTEGSLGLMGNVLPNGVDEEEGLVKMRLDGKSPRVRPASVDLNKEFAKE